MIVGPIDIHNIRYVNIFDIDKYTNNFLEEMRKDVIKTNEYLSKYILESDYVILESSIFETVANKIKEMFKKFKEFISKLTKKISSMFVEVHHTYVGGDKFTVILGDKTFKFDTIPFKLDNNNKLGNISSSYLNLIKEFKIVVTKEEFLSKSKMDNIIKNKKNNIIDLYSKIRGELLGLDYIDSEEDIISYVYNKFIEGGNINNKISITIDSKYINNISDKVRNYKTYIQRLKNEETNLKYSLNSYNRFSYDKDKNKFGKFTIPVIEDCDMTIKLESYLKSSGYLAFMIDISNKIFSDAIICFSKESEFLLMEYKQCVRILNKGKSLVGDNDLLDNDENSNNIYYNN